MRGARIGTSSYSEQGKSPSTSSIFRTAGSGPGAGLVLLCFFPVFALSLGMLQVRCGHTSVGQLARAAWQLAAGKVGGGRGRWAGRQVGGGNQGAVWLRANAIRGVTLLGAKVCRIDWLSAGRKKGLEGLADVVNLVKNFLPMAGRAWGWCRGAVP